MRPIFLATAILILGCGGNSDRTATFTKLTLAEYPGFGPAAPPGSSCDPRSQPRMHEVEGISRRLSFSSCSGQTSAPWQLQSGQQVLTPAELASVEDVLAQVLPSEAMSCGADAGVLTLDLERDGGVELLADDFYSGCPWEIHAGRTFVIGLRSLASVLNATHAQ